MKTEVLQYLPADCPYGGSFHWYETLDSTNTLAKALAKEGAPEGTVIAAARQTGGRGRMGRSFLSPEGSVYLSLILRPDCPAHRLMHLTCAVAVAACDAIEKVTGLRPGIKWINDLTHGGKKLGGILTELGLDPATDHVAYAVIGIGINCLEVPSEVADIADCLSHVTGKPISPAPVIAALLAAFYQMRERLFTQQDAIMDRYRKDCVTLGQQVTVLGSSVCGTAEDITKDGALLLHLADGSVQELNAGEVSVRAQN